MPHRTPARTSQTNIQQKEGFVSQQALLSQQQVFNNVSNNTSNNNGGTFNHQQQQQKLTGGSIGSSSGNMFDSNNNMMYQQQLFKFSNITSTCNNNTPPPPPISSSLHFHNNTLPNNNTTTHGASSSSSSTSSNKKRKHEFVNFGTNSSTTENSFFYHLESDFKRKSADKKRMVWTNELHETFVNAVTQLGVNDARPKEILELMNVPYLTTTHIKSHLQKYRQQLKKGIIPNNNSSHNEGGTFSESGTSDEQIEDIKDFKSVETSLKLEPLSGNHTMGNNHSSNNNHIFTATTTAGTNTPSTTLLHSGLNQSGSTTHPTSSQSLTSLMNDTGSDQVNYIKNILLHFNQLSNTQSNNNSSNCHSSYLPSSSSSSHNSQRPLQQHVTFANTITNNNITNVNQPHFHSIDGSSILQNCHLLTTANSLSEFLLLLQEICKNEREMATLFNNLPVQSTNDLNLIVEGFRIGFICGMKYKP